MTQAVFPEGGLSRDGRLRPPKLGLLDYMVRSFDPAGDRDIFFVPVGISYSRPSRTAALAERGRRVERTSGGAVRNTLRFVLRNVWLSPQSLAPVRLRLRNGSRSR